jgi:protein-S-isoprenylcysteine O-methyltransferase Ste14
LAIALSLQALIPLPLLPEHRGWLLAAGTLLMILGLSLSIAVVRTFRHAATPVSPRHPTTHLVIAGPYRYSRNPDYLGQLVVYTAVALALDTAWPLLFLPIIVAVLRQTVILREERYLDLKFGQEYRDYKARVGRWL